MKDTRQSGLAAHLAGAAAYVGVSQPGKGFASQPKIPNHRQDPDPAPGLRTELRDAGTD